MSQAIQILISAVIVIALALGLARLLKLSSKYERQPHKLSDWNAQDKGIDPTQDAESDR
jgi:hypothetical protein